MFHLHFPDFVLAITPAVDESVPERFYKRSSSFNKSRRLLLALWLIMATFLSLAYKDALLSSLVTLHYTEPLETIDQMVESGLPFYFPGGTVVETLLKTDPREGMMRLSERRVGMPYTGRIAPQYLKMY